MWPAVHYGLPYNMACHTVWPVVQDGLLYNLACLAIWPAEQDGLPYNMACYRISLTKRKSDYSQKLQAKLESIFFRQHSGGHRLDKEKRFTISDLEGNQPPWLKNKGPKATQMARQDVKGN